MVADAFQQSRLSLNVEDAETAQTSLCHAAYEVALACACAAAHGHNEALLARNSTQRIYFRSCCAHLLSLISRPSNGVSPKILETRMNSTFYAPRRERGRSRLFHFGGKSSISLGENKTKFHA